MTENYKSNEVVNIAYRGSTSDYLMDNGLPESVYSLCEHTKSNLHIYVNVLDGGNDRIKQFFEKIKSFFDPKITVDYSIFAPDFSVFSKEQINFDFASNIPKDSWRGSLAPEILWKVVLMSISISTIKVDKILSIGADTLFLDDVAKAYKQLNVDSDFLCAGCRDGGTFCNKCVKETNPDIDRENYISADCIMWNNKRCRIENIAEKMADDLIKNTKLRRFLDQDVQNIVIPKERKIILDQRWNVVPYFLDEIGIKLSDAGMIHWGSWRKPTWEHFLPLWKRVIRKIKAQKVMLPLGILLKKHHRWVPYSFSYYNKTHREMIKNNLLPKDIK